MANAEVIGSGKYGTVYKICMNSECKKKLLEKIVHPISVLNTEL